MDAMFVVMAAQEQCMQFWWLMLAQQGDDCSAAMCLCASGAK